METMWKLTNYCKEYRHRSLMLDNQLHQIYPTNAMWHKPETVGLSKYIGH